MIHLGTVHYLWPGLVPKRNGFSCKKFELPSIKKSENEKYPTINLRQKSLPNNMAQNFFVPRNGEKIFFGPIYGVWRHLSPENFVCSVLRLAICTFIITTVLKKHFRLSDFKVAHYFIFN